MQYFTECFTSVQTQQGVENVWKKKNNTARKNWLHGQFSIRALIQVTSLRNFPLYFLQNLLELHQIFWSLTSEFSLNPVWYAEKELWTSPCVSSLSLAIVITLHSALNVGVLETHKHTLINYKRPLQDYLIQLLKLSPSIFLIYFYNYRCMTQLFNKWIFKQNGICFIP